MEVYLEEYQHENLFRKAWHLTIPPLHTLLFLLQFSCVNYMTSCLLLMKLELDHDTGLVLNNFSVLLLGCHFQSFLKIQKTSAPIFQVTSMYYMGE